MASNEGHNAASGENSLDDLLSDALNDFDICDNSAKKGPLTTVQSPASNLEETLKLLNQDVTNATGLPNEDDLERMFAEFASNFASSDGNTAPDGASKEDCGNFLPVMESMMQSILSKDLLYPPLKELADKYPDWLADKRSTLSEAEYEGYNNQYKIAKELVETFERKSDPDKEQFGRIFELMQQMQTYGHPPKELVGNPPDMFDPSNPMSVPKECTIS
jgi:peroxin-19